MSDTRNQKYIFVKGVPTINPNYQAPAGTIQPSAPPANTNTLAVVTNMDDVMAMQQLTQLPLPTPFTQALETIQSDRYVAGFGTDAVDGGSLADGLMNLFAQNEIPIGLMSKLTPLQGATLHFKIDDSGSMGLASTVKPTDACVFTRQNMDPRRLADLRRPFLTRWEEAEDRLHTLIELIAYVPTGPIIFSFFDRPNVPGQGITLDRTGKSPLAFLDEAHKVIRNLFVNKVPGGGTPTLLNMINMLNTANQMRGQTDAMTMHFLLSDGEPDGGPNEINDIKNFLKADPRDPSSARFNRNHKLNPFTFLVCSDNRDDYEWMHEAEEVAFGKSVAALNDFRDEKIEVQRDQGAFFPYSRGFWLLASIAASINPNDLDALDQHAPLTKTTLEGLMGRGLTPDEFRRYWMMHPNAQRAFEPDYQQFLTANVAIDIPSVKFFDTTLAQLLSQDMTEGEDDSEMRAERSAEDALLRWRGNAGYGRNAGQYNPTFYSTGNSGYSSNNNNNNQYGGPRY